VVSVCDRGSATVVHRTILTKGGRELSRRRGCCISFDRDALHWEKRLKVQLELPVICQRCASTWMISCLPTVSWCSGILVISSNPEVPYFLGLHGTLLKRLSGVS